MESSIMSHHDSGESDGLGGIGLNGEEDYYDSITSGDEFESRLNRTRPLSPEPAYNPEPGIHDIEPPFNPEPGIHYDENEEVDHSSRVAPLAPETETTSNSTTFSTIVNGVKIKSLPGPRGNS